MLEAREPDLQKWLGVVAGYNGEFKKWEARVTKILKRYRDDARNQDSPSQSAKFNILWSNVETLIPAVFAKLPKADVSRRFSDNDPVGRVAAMLIERALDFEIEHYPDFRAAMGHGVQDRFLGGRGVAWVRYDPRIREQETQVTEDIEDDTAGLDEAAEEIDYECSPADYVHWKDFGHSTARTWEEVTSVWRWVYMGRDALVERFGEQTANRIPLDSAPEPLTKRSRAEAENDKAKICELWDKEGQRVYWFSESFPEIIDVRDDPLNLEGFFPCGRPLYATTTSDSLVPIPDFVLYQDQANELDILSDRIDGLVKALRVRGVYDASVPELQRLLTEGDNNSLIPVKSWLQFSEKGGLDGVVDILPIDTIAKALIDAYQAHSEVKEQVYEITGISDIIRGQTKASETATAQQIKGQYAGLRLKSMQESVALFATGILQRMAQIICTKYQDETILAYSAAAQLSDDDKQYISAALQLIKNNPLRTFRIEVAADSLVQLDEMQMKQDRVEFITAMSGLLKEAVPAGQQVPELLPFLMETVKFAAAGFKAGRQLEGTIDQALQQLKAKAQQAAQNPQPNPEMAKVQAQAQADQAKAAAQAKSDQDRMQADMQIEQAKVAMQERLEAKKQADAASARMEEIRLQEETAWKKAKLDAETKIMVARITANPGVDVAVIDAEKAASEGLLKDLGGQVQGHAQNIDELRQRMAEAHDQVMGKHDELAGKVEQAMKVATGRKRIIRGPDGRAVGVEPEPATLQ